jgi:4-oxalocrotonate tautomerase
MPLVQVKIFENELTGEQKRQLIEKITNSVTSVVDDKLREVTWIIIEEIKSGNWGVGGKALTLEDVKALLRA